MKDRFGKHQKRIKIMSITDEQREAHGETIIDWLRGAEIQLLGYTGLWTDIPMPGWRPSLKYRVKPEKRVIYTLKRENGSLEEYHYTEEEFCKLSMPTAYGYVKFVEEI